MAGHWLRPVPAMKRFKQRPIDRDQLDSFVDDSRRNAGSAIDQADLTEDLTGVQGLDRTTLVADLEAGDATHVFRRGAPSAVNEADSRAPGRPGRPPRW